MNSLATRSNKFDRVPVIALLLLTFVALAGCTKHKAEVASPSTTRTTFKSPEEAGKALQAAMKAGDNDALVAVLGPGSKPIVDSGDPAEDKAAAQSFSAKYERMNRWVTLTNGSRMLYIGPDNYPFPVPIRQDATSNWYFDSGAAQEEILARRIGRNELLAIDACNSIANAEELYYQQPHDGNPAHQYTQTILSANGKQDGLHWPVPTEQESSPLGKLGDFATVAVTNALPNGAPVFDGYAFRILTAQGDVAKGGARSYIVNGKLTKGFAIIASPVKYRDSGIMTFMMNREGVVYQKNLGEKTADIAASIAEYNPSDGWSPAGL